MTIYIEHGIAHLQEAGSYKRKEKTSEGKLQDRQKAYKLRNKLILTLDSEETKIPDHIKLKYKDLLLTKEAFAELKKFTDTQYMKPISSEGNYGTGGYPTSKPKEKQKADLQEADRLRTKHLSKFKDMKEPDIQSLLTLLRKNQQLHLENKRLLIQLGGVNSIQTQIGKIDGLDIPTNNILDIEDIEDIEIIEIKDASPPKNILQGIVRFFQNIVRFFQTFFAARTFEQVKQIHVKIVDGTTNDKSKAVNDLRVRADQGCTASKLAAFALLSDQSLKFTNTQYYHLHKAAKKHSDLNFTDLSGMNNKTAAQKILGHNV